MTSDVDAFERLYRAEYSALVGFFARRLGDVEAAKDLTADTFRIAWAEWPDARVRSRGWLFGVARHLLVDEYRRHERDLRRLTQLDADSRFSARDEGRAEDVRAVLDGLRDADREVLHPTYWEGLDARQCGLALGISRSAVWVRLHRARRAFAAAWNVDLTDPVQRPEGVAQ